MNCKALSPLKIDPREEVTKYVNYGLGNLINTVSYLLTRGLNYILITTFTNDGDKCNNNKQSDPRMQLPSGCFIPLT